MDLFPGGIYMRTPGTVGFVAFWKASDVWFTENENTKKKFTDDMNAIFKEAQSKGVVMHGSYDCSWSSEWRYFTFWECPNIEILEETCKKLQAIGDINKYNIQHHYVGRLIEE
jgi:hypothetical protein